MRPIPWGCILLNLAIVMATGFVAQYDPHLDRWYSGVVIVMCGVGTILVPVLAARPTP